MKRNFKFLQNLVKCGKGKRKCLINSASTDNINAISEAALNTLRGNIPLNKRQKSKLKKYKSKIRSLAKRRLSTKKRKLLLVQEGGVLPVLLAPLLSILAGVASKAVSSAIGL
jgi:hypothetical protein